MDIIGRSYFLITSGRSGVNVLDDSGLRYVWVEGGELLILGKHLVAVSIKDVSKHRPGNWVQPIYPQDLNTSKFSSQSAVHFNDSTSIPELIYFSFIIFLFENVLEIPFWSL